MIDMSLVDAWRAVGAAAVEFKTSLAVRADQSLCHPAMESPGFRQGEVEMSVWNVVLGAIARATTLATKDAITVVIGRE